VLPPPDAFSERLKNPVNAEPIDSCVKCRNPRAIENDHAATVAADGDGLLTATREAGY
jgi:hypothetical protein